MKWPNSTTVTPAKGRSVLTGSRLHEGVPVRRGDGAIEVAEAAFVLHLALGHRERLALDAGHEVEGLAEGAAHRAHGREVGQPRRHEHVRPRFLERLQPLDR